MANLEMTFNLVVRSFGGALFVHCLKLIVVFVGPFRHLPR